MRLGRTAFACACALAALAVLGSAVAIASVKPKKKTVAAKTKAAKKPKTTTTTQAEATCQLGQNTAQAKCTANPLFSKGVCDDYLSQVQSYAGPGATVITAGNRYGPIANVVGCYYTVNGKTQSFYFTVSGGAGFHTNSLVDKNKQIDLQQAFEQEYQQWVTTATYLQCAPQDPQPTAPGAVKTTVEGYEAFTVDQCAPVNNNVVLPIVGRLEVLAGTTWIAVGGNVTLGESMTSSQMIPFAEQLIAKYH